ncbi:MAG: hypothetical protein C4342_05125 [Armatimonadota bacterium]
MGLNTPRRELAASLLGGVGLSVAAWLVLVPWDLSELDSQGRLRPDGGDSSAGSIIAVVALVGGVGLIGALLTRRTRWPVALTCGGTGTWTVLFTWRAGTANTSGANMFMVSLVFLVVPTAVILPLLVYAAARWAAATAPNRRHAERE